MDATPYRGILAACAAVAVVVTGCGGSSSSDRAGGTHGARPVVLSMANGSGDAEELTPFADAVARLSGGTLRVVIHSDWGGAAVAYDTDVVRDVREGKVDLAWAGSRGFDSIGVRSFDALHAPLLIDNYTLEQKVLEGPLPGEMLRGLKPLGVVGLGILPGALHKPLGVSRLVGPTDYAQTTVAISRSAVAAQALRALGAKAAEIPRGAALGTVDGVEQQVSSLAGYRYDDRASNLTANVNLWPRPQVLFMNRRAFASLGDRQRRALTGAARAALTATIALERGGEREGAGTLCRRGVAFLTASAADLAALRRAVKPVFDRLRSDPQTRRAIAQIRVLRTGAAATPDAPACANVVTREARVIHERTAVDGVYVMDSTREEGARLSGEAPSEVQSENFGHWRFALDRGYLYYTQSSEGHSRWTKANYTVKGDEMTWHITAYGGEAPNGAAEKTGEVFDFRWSRFRDQLILKPVPGKISPSNFRVNPWRRVGDAP